MNPNIKTKSIIIIEWIFLYLSITDALAFAMGDSTLVLNYLSKLIVASKYVMLLVSIILIIKSHITLNYKYIWLPIVIWLVFFLSSLGGQLYTSPLSLLMICMYCVLPDFIKVGVFKKYRLWIVLMSLGGILAYLSFVLSLGIPFTVVDYYFGTENFYIDYIFSVIYLTTGDALRLCGLFNEPGFLGTIIALILIIEDCNLKKIGNIIILIAGFLTFSFAFYVLLFSFLFIRMVKNVPTIIVTVSIFLLLFSYVQKTQFENPQIQHLVDRFKIDKSSGTFSGDNRTSYEFDLAYQMMFNKGEWVLGKGTDAMDGKNYVTLSYKSLIYKFGVLGFFIIIGSLFIASYPLARRNRNTLIFLLCFFISIYQRPNVYSMIYFNLLFGGLLYIKSKVFEKNDLFVSKNKISKRS